MLLSELSLQEKVRISEYVIKRVLITSTNYSVPVFVGFSGGKDSLALLLLLRKIIQRDPHIKRMLSKEETVYIYYIYVPGNTHPGNRFHVEEIISLIDIPARFLVLSRTSVIDSLDFVTAVERWGFPRLKARWCMTEFKNRPLKAALRMLRVKRAYFLLGEKYSDSSKRKKIFERILTKLNELTNKGLLNEFLPCEYNSRWNQLCIYPIIHWSDRDVDYFLKRECNNIHGTFSKPWCLLYECIGTSGNCLYCIYVTSRSYYAKLAQLPCTRPFIEALARAELKQRSHFLGVYSKGRTYSIAEIVESITVEESPRCKDCPLV